MEEVVKIVLPEYVIMEVVLEFYNLERELFYSNFKSRKRELVLVRQLSMVFMKRHTKYSLSRIGGVFGKDHSTVLHAENKINGFLDSYEVFRKDVETMDELVRIKLKELPDIDYEKANYISPIVKSIGGLKIEKRQSINDVADEYVYSQITRLIGEREQKETEQQGNCNLPDVSKCEDIEREVLLPFGFIVWYSGMEKEKIERAYQRYLREVKRQ